MGLLKEFKEFAMRGNVIDLAVGIIIGGAFGKIVSSLVGDVMMPPIGLLLGKMDFSKMSIVLQKEVLDEAGKVVSPLVAIKYGAFLNMLIDFILVALAVFLLIKGINSLKRKQEAAPAAPATPPKQELLLEEIRDILKRK